MKKNLSLIIILTLLTLHLCCNGQSIFPDTINNAKSVNLTRLKGSKYFSRIPAAYKTLVSLISYERVRYQKDDNTYFQVVEIPNTTFVEFKSKISKQAIESQGAKVDVYKTIKYNGFDGIYSEGPSNTTGETQISLTFGDETYVATIVGVCLTADKSSKEELKTIFSNSYYDRSYDLNPLEVFNIQIDEAIAGFKYTAAAGNIFFYSPNGKADMQSMLDVSNYQVQVMPYEADSFEKVKELMDTTNSRFSVQGLNTSNIRKKEIVINGNRAFEITMDVNNNNNKKGRVYEAGIYKEGSTSAVLFIGIDNESGFFEKLKATAQSIKL